MKKKGGSFAFIASESSHAIDERLVQELMSNEDFIVKLRYGFQTKDWLYIETEFCEGGDMYNFVGMRGGGLSGEQSRSIIYHFLLGLRALHR